MIKKIRNSFAFALITIAVLFSASPAFADAPTLSIQSLSPGATVPIGNQVSFTLASSNFSGSLTYAITDSFGNSSTVSNSNINAGSGVFSWIPASADVGTHNLSILVTDALNVSTSVSQQIVVSGPAAVTIQSVSGSTVTPGTAVTFTAVASGFTSPVYAVSDSAGVSTMTGGAINTGSGVFSWTPAGADAGSHTITVTVHDSNGNLATATQVITVNASAGVSIQSLSPGATATLGQTVTFTTTATGFTTPTFTVSDSNGVSSVATTSINASSGAFSWIPKTTDIGGHTITVTANDSLGHHSTGSVSVNVTGTAGASISITNLTPGAVTNVGTPLSFTVTTYGFTSPVLSLFESFQGTGSVSVTSITSANLNQSGVFAWTPKVSDAGVHTLTISGIDASSHSATKVIQIVVNPGSNTPVTTTTQTPSTSTGYVFTKSLAIGSTGADVTALQSLLISQGHLSGTATGYYGTLTFAAVKSYQTAHGISPLGTVGPATRASLNSGTTSSVTPTTTAFTQELMLGSSGAEVTALQKLLAGKNLYFGTPTGYFDILTQAGLIVYQGQKGIAQTGTTGPTTRTALNAN